MYNVYLFLLLTAAVMAVALRHYHLSVRWFAAALWLLVLSETLYLIFTKFELKANYIYHVNIPIYLVLMYLFFRQHIKEPIIKRILLITVVAFVVLATGLSIFFYKSSSFPGIQLNFMGVILIGTCLYVLLTLNPIENIAIYKHPMAWISIGYIVFFSATFFLNGIFNKLGETGSAHRAFFHTVINTLSNCIMYSCFIIGLYFSNRLTKRPNMLGK